VHNRPGRRESGGDCQIDEGVHFGNAGRTCCSDTSGATISSSQVNADFDALKTAVDAKQDKPGLGSCPTTSAGQVAWAHISCPNAGGGCFVVNSYNPTGGAFVVHGAEEAGLYVSGLDYLLRLYAGRGHGQ